MPLILVVDDDADIRRLIQLRLRSRYEIVEADGGVAALDLLERHPVDLVVCDVMMPGMSGLDVCRQAKQRPGAFLPVVLVSALDEAHDRKSGLGAGADAYLSKPVDAVELTLCVQRLLKLREQDRLILLQLRELERVMQLKDDLMELLVHDLRNPLTSVRAALQLVQPQLGSAADRDLVGLGLAAASRIHELASELLDVGRLERGELQPTLAREELSDLVDDAVRTLTPAAVAAGVQLAADPVRGVQADVDRKLLLRAVENLISNAIRHTRSTVDVALTTAGEHAIISIADRGAGVPDPAKAKLFEKYGAPELNRLNLRAGYGLGLYITRHVVEQHGGSVELDDREGGGSVFRLLLPLAKQALPKRPLGDVEER